VSKELHNKIESQALKATELTSDLGNQMTLHKKNAIEQVNEIKEAIIHVQNEMTKSAQTWQKEAGEKVLNLSIEFEKLESSNKGHFEKLNSEMNAIKLKLFASTTVGCSPRQMTILESIQANLLLSLRTILILVTQLKMSGSLMEYHLIVMNVCMLMSLIQGA
jgi:hypothetical protein